MHLPERSSLTFASLWEGERELEYIHQADLGMGSSSTKSLAFVSSTVGQYTLESSLYITFMLSFL